MRFLPAVLALTLAILSPLRATDLPTIKAPLSDDPVTPGNTTAVIDLRTYFEVTDIVGPVVQFRTSAGTYNIEMVPTAALWTKADAEAAKSRGFSLKKRISGEKPKTLPTDRKAVIAAALRRKAGK